MSPLILIAAIAVRNPFWPIGFEGERETISAEPWQDEALARDGVSREVPCSALKGETVPDSLPATPKSPPTRRVPPRASMGFSRQEYWSGLPLPSPNMAC